MKQLVEKTATFPRKITDDIWILGNYFFNLFLVKGHKGAALVELGISAIVDSVIDQLTSLQISPSYLIMAHPHSDHVTGLMGLVESFPQAELVTANGAYDFINHPKAAEAIVKEDAFMSKSVEQNGFKPGREPIRQMILPEQSIAVEGSLELDLGGITLELTENSGHSPGSLMVHVQERRTVIASDSLGFHFNGSGFLPLFFTGFEAYKSSLQRIIDLNPYILGIAHQGPFIGKDVKTALDNAFNQTVKIKERIENDSRDDEVIAEELFQENYRDEFTLYTEDNIRNCCRLLVKRVRQLSE